MKQTNNANLINNLEHADAILFVYKKTIFELFECNGTATVELGGRSIFSNIIESNKATNNEFQISNDDFKQFFLLLTKAVNLLLCWKEPYIDIPPLRFGISDRSIATMPTNLEDQERSNVMPDMTASYAIRIELCQHFLENILKHIERIGWLVECLEIKYQRLSWKNQQWKSFLDVILSEITKRNRKIGNNQLDNFLLFFNMEKCTLQEKINNNDVQYLLC